VVLVGTSKMRGRCMSSIGEKRRILRKCGWDLPMSMSCQLAGSGGPGRDLENEGEVHVQYR
jgi:hypothetical protein